MAEQGPQGAQEAESHSSRGQEGRRHLLNLSSLSGHLLPPPLASWLTLLNLKQGEYITIRGKSYT